MNLPLPAFLADRRRIVLVVPPVTAQDRYDPMASAGNSLPPHAFLSLGAVARELGWDVTILEGPAEEIALGRCAEDLRRLRADVLLIVGGPHVTALGQQTPERMPVFDLGCVGEGEDALAALPVERILENIDRLLNDYGIRSLFFTDDSLMTLCEQFEQHCRGPTAAALGNWGAQQGARAAASLAGTRTAPLTESSRVLLLVPPAGG